MTTSAVIDDTCKPSPLFDTTAHLVQALTKKYSLDQKRLYATRQSKDDDKSHSGENAITKVVNEQGTVVATPVWDGRSTGA
ncbi:hypothetical protein [Streptomyces sp. MBT53]|uniref:hypothetical protein n=1 Tax=Streptomyces sp. MBT53 TaxID=1488384 RepID=UPI0019148F06|nr:hypothetical protein [Streptomyces sp. MBT53]MBK6016271.1 hypothetical protein [Streptomyces sp. MBT53]